MKIQDGMYVGSLCSLIVKHNNITVVISDEQLKLMKLFKNYDFHFTDDGELGGTGCRVAEDSRDIGNQIETNYNRKPEDELEKVTLLEMQRKVDELEKRLNQHEA